MQEGRPWIVYALIAANIAMFGVELAAGLDPISPAVTGLVDLGASYAPLTLHGEWWRLGSSMFLHVGLLHLVMNMLCLYQARIVEPVFGRVGFLVIYLIAGLGGGVATLLVSGNVVVAGASGAVFGVYGALLTKLVLHRRQFDPAGWTSIMRRLGTFLALNLALGLSARTISLSAHVGGLLVGMALAAALLAGAGPAHARVGRALVLAVLGLALTAGAVLALPTPVDAQPALHHFYALEKTVPEKTEAAMRRYQAHELTPAQIGAVLQRDAIAPYEQLHDELRAITDVPSRFEPLIARIRELVDARLAAYDAFKAYAAESDTARRGALFDTFTRREDAVGVAREAFTVEAQRVAK